MNIVRTGVILNTENYDECVSFYKEVLGLGILFQESQQNFRLTCFEFGESYLMVETGGAADPAGKSIGENPVKLRFNVSDIESVRETLRSHGIDAGIQRSAWGSTINIHDPDGNRIGIRDEPTFFAQIQNQELNT